MKVVLHVGMHKTGSSSIQGGLDGYDKDGVRYARFGMKNHSVPFVTVFGDAPEKHQFHTRRNRSASDVAKLRRQWLDEFNRELSLDRRTLVFSGEALGFMTDGAIGRINDAFRGHDVSVVAYVREPVSHSYSAFQQMVKEGYKSMSLPMPRYRERFEKFERIFGNIELRDYHRVDVVRDFCAFVGADELKDSSNDNIGLPFKAVQMLHLFNREGINDNGPSRLARRPKFTTRLTRLFAGSKPPPGLIGLRDMDAADILWIQERGFNWGTLSSDAAGKAKFADVIRNIAEADSQKVRDALGERRSVPLVTALNALYLRSAKETV